MIAPPRARTYDPLIKSQTEPIENPGKQADSATPPAQAPAVDSDLAAVVSAWPDLPEHVRATIRMLIDNTAGK
ncbi:MAG TPA: hypothetical protein VGM03_10810 [Phycisphaerae bacterium]|jgi:hypothetical protein